MVIYYMKINGISCAKRNGGPVMEINLETDKIVPIVRR